MRSRKRCSACCRRSMNVVLKRSMYSAGQARACASGRPGVISARSVGVTARPAREGCRRTEAVLLRKRGDDAHRELAHELGPKPREVLVAAAHRDARGAVAGQARLGGDGVRDVRVIAALAVLFRVMDLDHDDLLRLAVWCNHCGCRVRRRQRPAAGAASIAGCRRRTGRQPLARSGARAGAVRRDGRDRGFLEGLRRDGRHCRVRLRRRSAPTNGRRRARVPHVSVNARASRVAPAGADGRHRLATKGVLRKRAAANVVCIDGLDQPCAFIEFTPRFSAWTVSFALVVLGFAARIAVVCASRASPRHCAVCGWLHSRGVSWGAVASIAPVLSRFPCRTAYIPARFAVRCCVPTCAAACRRALLRAAVRCCVRASLSLSLCSALRARTAGGAKAGAAAVSHTDGAKSSSSDSIAALARPGPIDPARSTRPG